MGQLPRLGSLIRINLVLLITQMRLPKTTQFISSTISEINLTKINPIMIEKVIKVTQKISDRGHPGDHEARHGRQDDKALKINIIKNKVMKVNKLLVNPVLRTNLVKENKMTQKKLAKIKLVKIVKVIQILQSITSFMAKLNRKMSRRTI